MLSLADDLRRLGTQFISFYPTTAVYGSVETIGLTLLFIRKMIMIYKTMKSCKD